MRAAAKIDDAIPAQLQVKADKAQFTRLVSSLVTNAIKFHKVNESPEIIISASSPAGNDGYSYLLVIMALGLSRGLRRRYLSLLSDYNQPLKSPVMALASRL